MRSLFGLILGVVLGVLTGFRRRKRSWRLLVFGVIAVVSTGLLGFAGCGGPAIPPEELGETTFQVPKVPGAENPYPLPEPKFKDSEAGLPLPFRKS